MKPGNAKRLANLAATAVLFAACAQQPPPPPTWFPQVGATLPTPLPVRVVSAGDTPSQPTAPDRISHVGAVARTVASGLGGGLAGIIYGGGAGAASGPFGALAGAGAGAAVGLVVGLIGGGIETARAVHTDAEAAAATVILLRQLDPTRAGSCLQDTLVSRSAGRMIAADAASDVPLTIGLEEISLLVEITEPGRDPSVTRRLMPSNPPMRLHLHLHAPLQARPDQGAQAYGTGDWLWDAKGKRYFDWAARDGAALQEQLEIGIGILAQTILADLYPGDFKPPPRQGAEALRARCPPPPATPTCPVAIRVAGEPEAAPAR